MLGKYYYANEIKRFVEYWKTEVCISSDLKPPLLHNIVLGVDCIKCITEKVSNDEVSWRSGALWEKRELKGGVAEGRTEKWKEEHTVLHQVETSSDRSGADTEDNIHHKEQWSGP